MRSKQAERLVAVREGEEINQISAIEAVYRAQYAACKGNAYAQKHAIERYDWAERERRRQIEARIESWEGYVAEAREAIAKAERNGEPTPALLPHPDDVVLDHDTGVRFIGPLSEEGAKWLEETCRVRDMLIMQDALDQRTADYAESDKSPDDRAKPGTALLFALTLNNSVPDRLKLSDDAIEIRMLRYAGVAKRQLLKDLYRGWRSLGARPKRGQVLPPLHVGKRWLMLQCDVTSALWNGHLDLDDPWADLEAIIAKIQEAQLSADA